VRRHRDDQIVYGHLGTPSSNRPNITEILTLIGLEGLDLDGGVRRSRAGERRLVESGDGLARVREPRVIAATDDQLTANS
jgi:hypothetical protein